MELNIAPTTLPSSSPTPTAAASTAQINIEYCARIAAELKIKAVQVGATAELLAEGATVPFISRYRKEATGMLDEVQITTIRDRLQQFAEVDSRRESILKSLKERNLLTDALAAGLAKADTLTKLEDIFAPYRPKRRTKATIAAEKGLTPLADWIQENQDNAAADPKAEAQKYVSSGKPQPAASAPAAEAGSAEAISAKVAAADAIDLSVKTAEEALSGARDIIAERISDDKRVREALRSLYEAEATVSSKILMGKEQEPDAAKFRDYFEWSENIKTIPSHRLLAIRRGEKEGFLMMRISVPEDRALDNVKRISATGKGACADQIMLAATDACKRLLFPSMETEMRLNSKKKADAEAIRVFTDNIRELLNAAPLGEKRVLAIDPGFRTGCKVVVLSAQGALLHNDVIYPTAGSQVQMVEAARLLINLCQAHKTEAIAIGNGTAGRETEQFVRKVLNTGELARIPIIAVNESGASIYSASDVAREEFPNHDVTVRGAVSIGRRLMDPLAELVKIDPKSIGVGQYQHDVDQNQLKHSLDDSVISCVNNVGVEVNTASKQLLSYVSGLNKSIAENIVAYRNEKGSIKSRAELKKVPRLGDKAFEQAAGFLRIRGAENPLDTSAVHPERYSLVEKMAADLGCSVNDLITDEKKRNAIDLKKYVSETVGLPTLQDIMAELAKPGRDPRKQFEMFSFQEGVEKPSDLQVGMKLPGIVTNVTAFGAFVDIGVHQDGLVHVSQLADHFIKDASEVVKVAQKVTVTVMEVDLQRNRIALSMKSKPDFENAKKSAPTSGSAPATGPRQGGPSVSRPPQPQNRPSAPSSGGGFGGGWFDQAVTKGKK
jgi:uncharacterized protein